MDHLAGKREELEQKLYNLQEINKKLDIQKEYEKLKDTFIHLFSYEARAKLNTINGFTDLLSLHDLDDSKRKEYLKFINKGGNELLRIFNENLEIAQLEVDGLELFQEEIILVDFFNNLKKELELFKHQYNKHNVELDLYIDSKVNHIVSDKKRLLQVYKKLFESTVHLVYGGYIKFGFKKLNQDFVEFYMVDAGVGIHEKFIKIINEESMQFHPTGKTKYDEIIYNLYIAKKLIRYLGGDFSIKSKIGKGTEYSFVLKLAT
jgi:signal transduction histidine kinase